MIIKKLLEISILFLFAKSAMAGKTYNVLNYKARGDGKSDDTNIDGNITAPNKIWTNERTSLLSFAGINDLNIGGNGTIDGQGAVWWQCNQCKKPFLLAFDTCKNLFVGDIRLINSPSKHLTFNKCTNVSVDWIRITAPGDSPNTDGIVMQGTQHIQITRSIIGTGDDCIAILTGSNDIKINRCTCGPSHGISIGSLGGGYTEANVERIHVSNCLIFNSMTGVRIKTWQGGYGYARDITFEAIKVAHVDTPIVIDQSYMSQRTLQQKAVAISNIRFMKIYGTSTQTEAVKIECSPTSPCTGVTFSNIALYKEGQDRKVSAICENAYGTTNGMIVPSLRILRKSKVL
ncbi:hypothetical protein LUZ61_004928 [Rhynchospora tenuis]|uniref:Polygalacturonase At3g15720 n=1 Tax=Rhynchospora tenuis TaxID=198213 RepID=A0AAD5ZNU4_9POAL|nr:hypothetical protein LUZ61_004928 [Rhynchospora tenuis]